MRGGEFKVMKVYFKRRPERKPLQNGFAEVTHLDILWYTLLLACPFQLDFDKNKKKQTNKNTNLLIIAFTNFICEDKSGYI